MKYFHLLIMLVVFSAASASSANGAQGDLAEARKYQKRLNALPNGASSNQRIAELTKAITKLDPKRVIKVYKIALTKMPRTPASKTAATKLALDLLKIVEKSDLTDALKGQIVRQFRERFFDERPLRYMPTPTPTPSPPVP